MVKYVERESIDTEKAVEMIELVEEEEAMYPWNIVAKVLEEDEEEDDVRMGVLKPLVKNGYLMVNADGKIIIDERNNFFEDYEV